MKSGALLCCQISVNSSGPGPNPARGVMDCNKTTPYSDGLRRRRERQHRANFELWHIEDEARVPGATDAELAGVKRRVDRPTSAATTWPRNWTALAGLAGARGCPTRPRS
jgi:hypothetical protein